MEGWSRLTPERQCHTEACEEDAAEGEEYCEGCIGVWLDYQRDLNRARAQGEGFDWREGLNLTWDVIYGRMIRTLYVEERR